MVLRSLIPLAALGATLAAPALAWTTSVPAGEYRLTASIQPAVGGAQSLRLALDGANAASAGLTLHAWFVDSEGLILGPAALGRSRGRGASLVALDPAVAVPAGAATLVVLAQPDPVRSAGGQDAAPAVVTQIALPAAGLSAQ